MNGNGATPRKIGTIDPALLEFDSCPVRVPLLFKGQRAVRQLIGLTL